MEAIYFGVWLVVIIRFRTWQIDGQLVPRSLRYPMDIATSMPRGGRPIV